MKSLKGSILLMLSLFLPLCWNFIPADVIWSFPFFDASTKEFSLDPAEYRSYPLRDILPFYFMSFQIPIYIYCNRILPSKMELYGFNIWNLYFLYFSIQAIDLMMCFSQLPYYRTAFIIAGCFLQFYWIKSRFRLY